MIHIYLASSQMRRVVREVKQSSKLTHGGLLLNVYLGVRRKDRKRKICVVTRRRLWTRDIITIL